MEIYSFDNVTMLVNERPITGYAEGSTIKIEDNEDSKQLKPFGKDNVFTCTGLGLATTA